MYFSAGCRFRLSQAEFVEKFVLKPRSLEGLNVCCTEETNINVIPVALQLDIEALKCELRCYPRVHKRLAHYRELLNSVVQSGAGFPHALTVPYDGDAAVAKAVAAVLVRCRFNFRPLTLQNSDSGLPKAM